MIYKFLHIVYHVMLFFCLVVFGCVFVQKGGYCYILYVYVVDLFELCHKIKFPDVNGRPLYMLRRFIYFKIQIQSHLRYKLIHNNLATRII